MDLSRNDSIHYKKGSHDSTHEKHDKIAFVAAAERVAIEGAWCAFRGMANAARRRHGPVGQERLALCLKRILPTLPAVLADMHICSHVLVVET